MSDVTIIEEDEETVEVTTDRADVAEAGKENATEKGAYSDSKEDVKGEDGEGYYYYGDNNDDHKNQDYQDEGNFYYDNDDSDEGPEDYNDDSDYEHDEEDEDYPEEDEDYQEEEFKKNVFKSKTVGKNTIPGKL